MFLELNSCGNFFNRTIDSGFFTFRKLSFHIDSWFSYEYSKDNRNDLIKKKFEPNPFEVIFIRVYKRFSFLCNMPLQQHNKLRHLLHCGF